MKKISLMLVLLFIMATVMVFGSIEAFAAEYITINSPSSSTYNRADIYVSWNSSIITPYYLTLTDTSVNLKVLNNLSMGIQKNYTIPKKYLYEGHKYKVTISASSSQVYPSSRSFGINLSSTRQNIVTRGDRMNSFTWKPSKDVRKYGWTPSNPIVYRANELQTGIPYSKTWKKTSSSNTSSSPYYVPWNYTNARYFEEKLQAPDFYSVCEGAASSDGKTTPMYGSDCSTYSGICWNIDGETSPTKFLNGSISTKVGTSNDTAYKKLARLSPGDVVSTSGHTMVIASISYSGGKILFGCNEQAGSNCARRSHDSDYFINGGYSGVCKIGLEQDYTWRWQ